MKTIAILILSFCLFVHSSYVSGQALSQEGFKEPSINYWPRPLWFWNNTSITEEGVEQQMLAYRDLCGYGGFGILPFGKKFKPEYLKEDYFRVYGKALEKAKQIYGGHMGGALEEHGIWGSPDRVIESIERHRALGVSLFVIEFFGRDTRAPARLFHETVVPAFA